MCGAIKCGCARAFDVAVSSSVSMVDALSHQLFILDGTQDNTVTFTRLPEGRAMVLALVFRGQGDHHLAGES